MHSYPAWKIWLVVIVLLVGTVLALPNVFGEAPALQLSRNDRTAVTDAERAAGRLDCCSRRASTVENSYLEGDRLVLRFDDVSTRLKARDVLQQGIGQRIPGGAVRRAAHAGLDARDRAEADEPRPRPARRRLLHVRSRRAGRRQAAAHEHGARLPARCCARSAFRSPAWPATASTRSGSALRSGDDAERFASLLRKQDPNLTVDTDTLGEGGSVTVTLSPTQIKQRQDFAIQQNITTLRNRVDELGVTEPIVARQGLDRIVVQLPGVQDPNEALRVLGATATLEFRLVDDQNDAALAEQHQARAARLEALPHARWPPGAAQARDDRLGRAADGCQLRLPAGRARGHGHARCARRVEDARDDAPEPRPADGRRVHREEARGRRPALQGHARRQRMHRGGGHQRGHDPRRVRQQLPDHGRDGQRGA